MLRLANGGDGGELHQCIPQRAPGSVNSRSCRAVGEYPFKVSDTSQSDSPGARSRFERRIRRPANLELPRARVFFHHDAYAY